MAHPDLRDAKQALDELSADPKARQPAQDRVLCHFNYDDGIARARKEAFARGRAQGHAEGKAEGRAEGLRTATARRAQAV